MGKILEGLVRLQSVERELWRVRRRLNTRANAVAAQQKRIDQLRTDWGALNARATDRRKAADGLDLDLRAKEEKVAKLRTALNTAKTNKEYATILTQINTFKADNAKVEESALRALQDVDSIREDADKVQEEIAKEQQSLDEITRTNHDEIARLNAMVEKLQAKRVEAIGDLPSETIVIFDRLAATHDGEAMASIEIHGKKPPHTYICGGCYMGINAEHTNALRVRDEIRQCGSCGRILYIDEHAAATAGD